jgi:hypothetical protein
MKPLYWITGKAAAAQRTSMFMMLIGAEGQAEAVAGCAKALTPDWISVEIDQIRVIDTGRSYEADDMLREAIAVAEDKGFFLFLCDQPLSS